MTIYDDRIRLEMIGVKPDASHSPHGWPSELPLPPGGRLIGANMEAATWMMGFLQMWMFLLRAALLPLRPVMRLLTSHDSSDGGAATSSSADSSDGLGVSMSTDEAADELV